MYYETRRGAHATIETKIKIERKKENRAVRENHSIEDHIGRWFIPTTLHMGFANEASTAILRNISRSHHIRGKDETNTLPRRQDKNSTRLDLIRREHI